MGNISIYLTNLGKYNEGVLMGEWVRLPIPGDKLEEVLARIGIGEEYEEYFISEFDAAFNHLNISEFASLEELNDLAARLDALEEWDHEKLSAVLEMESPTSITDIMDIIDHLDDFDLLAEVEDDVVLGLYYGDECGTFQAVPEHLRGYIDYEAYGRDIRLECNGYFTSHGFVVDNR